MKHNLIVAVAVLGVLLAAVPAFSHHSVQAQFDFDKPLSLTGVLTKVEWVNPHSYMFLDVKDAAGKVKKWALELVGPGGLRKAGLSRIDRGGFNNNRVGDPIHRVDIRLQKLIPHVGRATIDRIFEV